MRRMLPTIKFSLAMLIFVVSLTTAFWDYKVSAPRDNWSKTVTIRTRDAKTTGYQMMVYVDRPIMRLDQICKTYLRIRNTGRYPLELTSTYITNRTYADGELLGEEIGDWQIHGSPLELLPGAVHDVEYGGGIMIRYPEQTRTIGSRGFQFNGFGLQTNTVTVYVLPSRPFWLGLTAVAALALWRAWLGTKLRRPRSQNTTATS